ncbi:UxaA family hydrolase, partial [Bacillus sp. SIMBA_154]
YCFMDSPGNDLESIAGQVAAGANLILFTTGNGSITNFPFVPTIKIVTTTERFELLESDMDFNAGSLMDGKPFQEAV